MYIGNDLQIAHPSYKIIDDISSGFNGSTTSFALQVNGATPVPFPISTQQVMISVNGVVQEPDPSGSAGFKLLGSNIVFSSAPANGHAFFGVINAGADYVTAGSEFPDGSATAPSFTFQDDQDTGWFRSGSGAVGYSSNGVQTLTFDGNGLTVTGDASFVGDSSKNLLWDKSDGALEFADNAKAVFGASSDLQIFHDGSHSFIKDTGTGALQLSGHRITMRNGDATSEYMFTADENGAVELYHDNVKTFETVSNGIKVLGPEGGSAFLYMYADEGDDNADQYWLKTEQDGTGFLIQNNVSGSTETNLRAVGNGSVDLYHNNIKTFLTSANGIKVLGPEGGDAVIQLNADEGDDNADYWSIKSDTSGNFKIGNDSTGSYVNGLTLDGSNNATFAGDIDLADSKKIKLGAGDDLQCFHDATDSYLTNGTGELRINNIANTNLKLYTNNNPRLTIANDGHATFSNSVSDSKGDLRDIPRDNKTSAYTLVASDAGKCISTDSGITVNTGVFSDANAVTLINGSASEITITAGSGFNLYNSATATTGNKKLAARGMATIFFTHNTTAYMSGAGLSDA